MIPLIVLDINGMLCIKLEKRTPGSVRCPSYDVKLRPYVTEFLHHMYTYYKVAFFSSTTEKNAIPICNALLTEEQRNNTLFFWFRDKTRTDPESNDHSTIKLVHDIREIYDYAKILIIDDSATKLRFNHASEVLVCDTYERNDDDTHLLDLITMIDAQIELLATHC